MTTMQWLTQWKKTAENLKYWKSHKRWYYPPTGRLMAISVASALVSSRFDYAKIVRVDYINIQSNFGFNILRNFRSTRGRSFRFPIDFAGHHYHGAAAQPSCTIAFKAAFALNALNACCNKSYNRPIGLSQSHGGELAVWRACPVHSRMVGFSLFVGSSVLRGQP